MIYIHVVAIGMLNMHDLFMESKSIFILTRVLQARAFLPREGRISCSLLSQSVIIMKIPITPGVIEAYVEDP